MCAFRCKTEYIGYQDLSRDGFRTAEARCPSRTGPELPKTLPNRNARVTAAQEIGPGILRHADEIVGSCEQAREQAEHDQYCTSRAFSLKVHLRALTAERFSARVRAIFLSAPN